MTRILIRGIVGIIFFVFIFVSFFSISLALEVGSNKLIVLSKDEVVDEDYFAAEIRQYKKETLRLVKRSYSL
ncbi:hypothetical protein HY612_05150 [Candidatus Roizmanbacteria bacterium]|nr:hypothetical protein [Candidatus Roizmanbacteria bacterium]